LRGIVVLATKQDNVSQVIDIKTKLVTKIVIHWPENREDSNDLSPSLRAVDHRDHGESLTVRLLRVLHSTDENLLLLGKLIETFESYANCGVTILVFINA